MKHKYKVITLCLALLIIGTIKTNALKTIDSIVINTMDDVVKAGTYFVETAIEDDDGNEITKLIRIHVKYPRTILDYDKVEGIDAHDIVVEPNTINQYTEEQLKIKGGAHAWSMDTGEEINVVKSEILNPTRDFAINDVKYSTEKDVSTNISVYTQEEINLKFDQVYINHNYVFTDTFRFLSLLLLFLTLLPILVYVILFFYLQHKHKKAQEFLYNEKV